MRWQPSSFFFIPPHNILLFYCWIITPGKIKVSPSRELSSGRETSSFSVVFALKGVWDRRLTSLNRSLGMWEPCRMEQAVTYRAKKTVPALLEQAWRQLLKMWDKVEVHAGLSGRKRKGGPRVNLWLFPWKN